VVLQVVQLEYLAGLLVERRVEQLEMADPKELILLNPIQMELDKILLRHTKL
jgi:hypothetical protein